MPCTPTSDAPTSPASPLFDEQRDRFEQACAVLDELGAGPRLRHAANSAALLRDSRVWYDFVRPGLLLYGLVPPPLGSTLPLKPVMSLTSRVVAVKGVRTGETVGYGGRFRAERATTLAVIPAGYADGLDRRLEGTRLGVDSRPPRADRRRRQHGHADGRRHRHRRRRARR